MVKKIKLDFSKVEERSGWNTKIIPEGLYKMKIVSVDDTDASDGTDMLTYGLQPTDPRYKARLFPYYCKQQPNQMWKLRDLLVAAGMTVPKKAQMVDPNQPVGKFVAVEVGDGTGQYANRSEINGVYGLDVLDEDGDDAQPDDEDDEEYEGDEEADSDDEGDEEDDDEAEEDLNDLTLAELRKIAKPLGIEGYLSLKKPQLIEAIEEAESEADEDEDDDLDDEDLEDEELDEEEFEEDEDEDEEPAPAPKRRPAPAKAAAKAPARKAPAAKAAPAKRVVKRR